MDFESTVSAIPPRAHMLLTCLFSELKLCCQALELPLNYKSTTERDRSPDRDHEEAA